MISNTNINRGHQYNQKFLEVKPELLRFNQQMLNVMMLNQVIFSRDDFGLGLNRNLKGFERYRMSGSDEEGDYTLDIDSVTLEDDAKFQCQVNSCS